MDTTLSRLRHATAAALPWVKIRPYTGRIVLDLVFLLIVGALHETVLPSLVGSVLLVDLMTPWLVTTFVAAPLPRALLLGTFGALILETHSAAPAGLYVTVYWMIAVVLRITRGTLSWRHAFPWAVTFLVSELWVILFESFVIGVGDGGNPFDLRYVLTQAARLVASVLLGMLLCRRFMELGVGEEPA